MMTKRVAVAIDGPVIYLRGDEVLEDTHVIVQQPVFGRILFTKAVGVVCTGVNIIRNNLFEGI